MLSVILYGRNDHHGYNYHKRFAISLNCIAEMLSLPEDEILFVDYNTPDDEPTILESLQDTLTEKTKKHLKTFRVRPCHHRLIKSPLSVCEPVARNVALRRSNPNNKWILSTNIDMIFTPFSTGQTLSEIVAELADGFYQLPRFEIPENLWESKLNRLCPQDNIAFLRENGKSLHLNSIVRREDFRMFDNPGDFQLMLRKDIFHIGGFDEEMRQGWHVDSNLSKRMFLLYDKKIHSLEDRLAGYHCNHTRKSSLLHSKHHAENDWGRFVQKVDSSMANQSINWGLAKEEIEEVRLNTAHVDAVENVAGELKKGTYEMLINHSSYNAMTYPLGRVFAHLMDHLCHLPNKSNIAYIGHNTKLPELLENYFLKRKLECKVLKDLDLKEMYSKASLIIFDFGFEQELENSREKLKPVMEGFLKVVKLEKENRKNVKFIGINVMNTDFRALFHRHLSLLTNSYVAGVIYGYIEQKKKSSGEKTKGLKKKLMFLSLYFFTRYFYSYTDRVRNFLHRHKVLDKFMKT